MAIPEGCTDQWYIERHGLVLVLAGMGIAIAYYAEISIRAANKAAEGVRTTWNTIRGKYSALWELLPDLAGGGDESAVAGGSKSALRIPFVVILAWLLVGVMVLADYKWHKSDSTPSRAQAETTHQCGQPVAGDLGKLTLQQLVQELACSTENTEILQEQVARSGLQLVIRPLPSKDKKPRH
jgi:hypothetical protein